ncbi:hypothetical protein CBS9595_001988 [Malassezia furfur]|nr:hypothetical protein CBS9595_001988 [Malassezia furfur]
MGLATFITPLAKGLVDETASYYAGVYIGKNSQTSVLKRIEEADAVFRVGYFPTDSNTGGFSSNIPVDRLIDLNMGTATIFGQDSQTVNQFGHVLVSMERASQPRLPVQIGKPSADLPVASESTISQAYLWSRFASFLNDGDTIISETGTSSFALPDLPLRKDCQVLAQQLYDSIGWSVGAAVGAAHGIRDLDCQKARKSGRVIVFVGDGSLQMTVQDLSALVRMRARNVLVCILNNDGYTVERILHGPRRPYNDIVQWDYSRLISCFDPTGESSRSFKVTTEAELDSILGKLDGEFPLTILDMHVAKMDVPYALQAFAMKSREHNAYGYAPEYMN